MSIDESHSGDCSSIAKLLPEPAKTALIDHIIEIELIGEESGAFLTQLCLLDLDIDAFVVRRHDQEGDPVSLALEGRQLLVFLFDKPIPPQVGHGNSSSTSAH